MSLPDGDEFAVHPALADDGDEPEPESPGERAERHRLELESLVDHSDPANPHVLVGIIGHGLLMVGAELRRVAGALAEIQRDLERIRRATR